MVAVADEDLLVDPRRLDLPETGIYVRARNDERWGSYDIVSLEKPSLKRWLRSRGGYNPWAEEVVMILLGYPNES